MIPGAAAAKLVAKYLAAQDVADAAIVAHSKGGLIGKYLMMTHDGERRVERMVAVCAPFSGSRYARFMLAPSLRAFSPRNALTLQLSREESVNRPTWDAQTERLFTLTTLGLPVCVAFGG